MLKYSNIIVRIVIILAAGLFFLPFLGGVHLFDWDEINFAEVAREMIVTGDYSTVRIDFLPFWEKPPLFIWMQVASMKIFGINEFAARFPNALCGVISLLVLFETGKKYYNQRFGVIWALAYIGSIFPHFYFKSGIIDPWFNLFIFLGLLFFVEFVAVGNNFTRHLKLILSAFFTGLAVLTKGPVAVVIIFITVLIFWILMRYRWCIHSETTKDRKPFFSPLELTIPDLLMYIFFVSIVGGFWFIIQAVKGNFDTIIDFIQYQIRLFTTKDAGHGGFFFYHFIVLFFGVFPASVFFLKAFSGYEPEKRLQMFFSRLMKVLFWVVLILFTIVKTKIIHYSSLCYFPITFLSAKYLYKIEKNNSNIPQWIKIVLFSISALFTTLLAAFQVALVYKEQIMSLLNIENTFIVSLLNTKANWTGYECLIILFLIFGIMLPVISFRRYKIKRFVFSVFISTALFTNAAIYLYSGEAERYSQNAPIEFYKSISKEDCYVKTLGFKSYAHYFYAQTKPPANMCYYNSNWLLHGKINKTVYFVAKINNSKKYEKTIPRLKKLYEKNGFVFYKREP